MCNLYSNTTGQELMRRLFQVEAGRDLLGNAEPLTGIWPKYVAPVVRLSGDGVRELVNMHWGFLTPKVSEKTGKVLKPDAWNNARDDKLMKNGMWKSRFQNGGRCLIPGTAFREAKGQRPATDVWFTMASETVEDRPPFAFAGLWRKGQPGIEGQEGDWITHTMVTTTPNELIKPVHPTRMPVILDPSDYETWLTGSDAQAMALLKPFPAERMRIARQGIGILNDEAQPIED